MSKMSKIKGVTSTGFEFEVSLKRLNNYELVEFLGKLDSEPLLLPKVVVMILGEKQTELLKEHVRDEEGIIDTEVISKELEEILKSQNQLKN